jgi:3-hydroxyacyl-[acyl-carrier-protein] dehydratase
MSIDSEILTDLDAYTIQRYQQNRYPCFFVDWIQEAIPGKSARGFKNFTFNEWFFPGHFEDEPNVPGFVQIETLTQVFLMTFLTMPENKGLKTAFLKSNATFKKKIIPGDRLDVDATLDFYSRGLAKGKVVGCIKGDVACTLELSVAIPDVMRQFMPKSN